MSKRFTAVVAFEGAPTGDGRMIEPGALTWGAGPWPLLWQRNGGGHEAAVVGEVTSFGRDDAAIVAEGVLHTSSVDPETVTAATRVSELFEAGAVGLSVGLDDETVEIRIAAELVDEMNEDMAEDPPQVEAEDDPPQVDADGRITVARWSVGDELRVTTAARIREVSVVDVPAFAETGATLVPDEAVEAVAAASGLVVVAAAGAADPAFANPRFGDPETDSRLVLQHPERPAEPAEFYGAPITVDADGVVSGHAMLWARCHGGFQDRCLRGDVLRGMSLSRFLCGSASPGVATGPLTVATTHHDPYDLSVTATMDHYANTGRAVADVTCGEDRYGLWVAGRLRPGVTDRDLADFVGSPPSIDARPFSGKYALAGILMVNNPGFLVERAEAKMPIAAAFGFGAVCGECGTTKAQPQAPDLESVVASLEARVRLLEVVAGEAIIASIEM